MSMTNPPLPLFYQGWARALSLLLAAGLSLFILIWPRLIAESSSHIDHGMLSLQMLGISGCFVHGLGFIPHHPIPKWLFSPYCCWPMLLVSVLNWIS